MLRQLKCNLLTDRPSPVSVRPSRSCDRKRIAKFSAQI
jgi:hypothetical protein